MQRKGVIAFGFLVGVAIVAGMLRVKFYFDPPENNFSTEIADLFIPVEETEVVTTETLTATPQAVDTVQYVPTQQYDLGNGIVLDILTTTDRIWTIQLQGSELVSQAYDLTWLPVADSRRVLQTEVQLVAGLPPVARLIETSTGFSVVHTVAQTETTYRVVLNVYGSDWTVQSDHTLKDNLSVAEPMQVVLEDAGIWIVFNNETLQFYTLSGILDTTQQLANLDTNLCALVPDQENIVLVLESDTVMTVQKQTPYGVVIQAVSFPRPDELARCQAVKRAQEQFVVQLVDRIVPYADNLSEQYAPIALTSTQWFPVVALQGDELWLVYSTSTTLGQYQSHVNLYSVTVTPLDATTEYTN